MKKFVLPAIIAFSILGSSCVSIEALPEINTKEIAIELRDKIIEEINTTVIGTQPQTATSDSISSQSITYAESADRATPVIENINVKIDVNDSNRYSLARKQLGVFLIIGIAAIIAFTIIFTFICLLTFFFKKAKSRNNLISKAIDANYTLPDSFYQQNNNSLNNPLKVNSTENVNDENNIPPVPRDQRLFNKAVKYISVGVGFFIVFSVWGAPQLGILGIIPILIGLGTLLNYYGIGR